MKIYDCFPFFNEMDLLEIRLNELNDVVDYFVVVEAERTHQNQEKELYFSKSINDDRFIKFKDKIIHVVIKGEEFNDNSWHNEKLQFSSCLRGLNDAESDDLIILGALDEIPKKTTLEKLKNENYDGIGYLYQDFYYFYLDTVYEIKNEGCKWFGNVVGRKKHVEGDIYHYFMQRQKGKNLIDDGGWHFSFLGDAKNAITKIRSYAHYEFNHLTESNMIDFIENLKDPLGRGDDTKFLHHEKIENLPLYVQENIDKFKKHIHQLK
jgi:beta-1,4-mannosyl-glycoprotein beta-1,4-N-acetylglucosaminyltransferase